MPKPSYFDYTPTIHSHEEMMERLAQRTKAPPPKQTEPPPPPSPLQWLSRNTGENRIYTVDARYSIDATKDTSSGIPVWIFDAWRRSPRAHLGQADSVVKAKRFCEDDNSLIPLT